MKGERERERERERAMIRYPERARGSGCVIRYYEPETKVKTRDAPLG